MTLNARFNLQCALQARSQRGAGGLEPPPTKSLSPPHQFGTKDSVITNFAGTDKSAISIIVLTVCLQLLQGNKGRFSSAVLALRSCADWSFYGYVRKHVFVPDASAEAEQSINEPRAQMPPVLVLLAFEKHHTEIGPRRISVSF